MTKEKFEWLESIGAQFHKEQNEYHYAIGSFINGCGWHYVMSKEFVEGSTLEEIQKEYEENVKKTEWSKGIKDRIQESGYQFCGDSSTKSKHMPGYILSLACAAQSAFQAMNEHERCCIVLEYDQKALNAKTHYYVYDSNQESNARQ